MHMDSCGGHNKTNIVLAYFLLQVILGHHQKVVLKYMTVGHTKIRTRSAVRDDQTADIAGIGADC